MTTSQFRQPEYLGPSHEPKHRVRCPIHGFIRFSDTERQIIDNPLFRRLRFIRQLALTELVYPGATHTRFEHSLGVMETATRIFDRIAAEKGALLEALFKKIPVLTENTMAKARQICRLAALLHDIGHCCFSHAVETVMHKDSSHEKLSALLIRTDEFLKVQIDSSYFPECADLTANLIVRDPKSDRPQLRILRDIVSGQVDADRTDYLLRDAYHCGVDYGRFDYRRLIECLTVWHDDNSDELEIAIHRDGVQSFESLILARYQMNTQVYYHRLRRVYDRYLEEYFKTIPKEEFDSPQKIVDWNDIRAMNHLMLSAADTNAVGHPWAKRIIERRHHRDVFALEHGDGFPVLQKVRKIHNQVQLEFPEVDFIADLPDKPISIHKLARDSDQDGEGIDFPMIDAGKKVSLGDRSHVLRTLSKSFRLGFIFADVEDREKRQEIAARCRNLRNQ